MYIKEKYYVSDNNSMQYAEFSIIQKKKKQLVYHLIKKKKKMRYNNARKRY